MDDLEVVPEPLEASSIQLNNSRVSAPIGQLEVDSRI